jgi:hypothetical protein
MLAGPGRGKITRSANNPAGDRGRRRPGGDPGERGRSGRGAGPLDAGADAQWVGDDSLPPAEKIGQVWEGPVPAGVARRPARRDVAGTQDVSDCDLAGGSSGGPWLRGFDPTSGKGTIFGVTSRGTMSEDGVTQDRTSAAFTDAVKNLYEQAGKL